MVLIRLKILLLLVVLLALTSKGYCQTSGGGTYTNHQTSFCDQGSGTCYYPYRVNVTTGSIYNPIGGQVYINTGSGGGGSMTWPSSAGIAVYSGSSSWSNSLAEVDGDIIYGSGGNWVVQAPPTWNQDTTGTATNATNTAVTDDTTTNATMYPTWVTANTGNLPQKTSSTKLYFNPSSGLLTATGFSGPLTGNVTGNASGTAATVTGAAQTNITSLGTLSSLLVSGNVGIGTSVPTAQLQVNGTSQNVYIPASGNVGIGSSVPAYALDTNGTIHSSATGSSYFGGNVGLGTTAPTSVLQVTGTCGAIGPVGTCWTSTGQLGYCSGTANVCSTCTAC